MPVSEARLSANRQNALKSTGPKTSEGKSHSRQNGLKHGLSGSGMVVAPEDRGEIERRTAALEADLKPASPLGQILVRQMALLSVRMERGARQEAAALAGRVRHAIEDFDEAMIGEAEALFRELSAEPRRSLRKLRQFPEGIDRLLEAWRELRVKLARDGKPLWTKVEGELMANLVGIRSADARGSRIEALSQATWGYFQGLTLQDGANLDDLARKVWARDQLLEQIDAEIASLAAQYEALDHETIELDRREAPDRALFDPSKEATLARRYDAESRRGFFKALNEFRQAEAEFQARAEAAKPAEIADPLASSCAGKEPRPRDPRPTDRTPLPQGDRACRTHQATTSKRDRVALIPS